MPQKLKLTDEQISFLHNSSTMLYENGEPKWIYLPYWFKVLGDGFYDIFSFENLPSDLKKRINDDRGFITNKNEITQEEVFSLIKDRGLTIEKVLDVIIDANRFVGVGLISLGDQMKEYVYNHPEKRLNKKLDI